jgi:uncharacterized protein involved in type VI secretion and phage assembly
MPKVLIVDTVLGQAKNLDLTDELMLTELTGQEGISMPFFYDLTMVRDPAKPDIPPPKMIGTMCRIGIARQNSANTGRLHDDYVLRTGMILHFEKVQKFDQGGGVGDTSRSMYKAHVVPTFHVLGRETRFRIFEDLSAFDILKRIFEDMQARAPDLFRFNLDKLDESKFPKMEYCVQFGEATYSFVARLMDRFNMCYYFDDDKKQDKLSTLMQAENQTLFIASFPNVPATACDDKRYRLTGDDPTPDAIADFQHQFELKFDRMWFGNFNIINPADPPTATDKRSPNFDLLADHAAVKGYSIREDFPEPAANRSEESNYAIGQGLQEEERIFSVSGGTKNPSLLAGRLIEVFDSKEAKADGNYLLKLVILNAYEHSYLTTTLTDISNFIFRDFLFAPFRKKKGTARDAADLTVSVVNAGLNNYLQNQQASQFNVPLLGGDTSQNIYHNFGPFFVGGITQVGITSAVSALVDTTQSLIDANAGAFSNTFVALPHTGAVFRVPTPSPAPQPVAHGPHTALVIGPDGIDTKNQDIFCDALGRVRVRFPWDQGPPRGGASLPPSWTADGSNSDFALHHGDNTCWVRVSEGWAGRNYGTQFLPRIGQEVIVDFIAGDPERPIITGRVYNADTGPTNLPFPEPSVEKTVLKNRGDNNVKDAKELPETQKSNPLLSGIKTQSIPTTGKENDGSPFKPRFHLLRFYDKRNHEQYLIRSQHRLDITALEKRYESISSDRHLTVGGKQPPPPGPPAIGGSYFAKVFQHYHLHVGDPDFPAESGNRITLIEQNDEIKIVKDSGQSIGGNWSADVGGQATINAMGPVGTIVLNAAFNITLMVGASSIVITPAGISITAPVINLVAPAILSTVPVVPMGAAALPPGIPIPPEVQKPTDPTAADPGDTLTPPE